MNIDKIIASADPVYKSPMLSWNRSVAVKLSDILGKPVAGEIRVSVCKTAGGPATIYQMGETCADGLGFQYMWNSPKTVVRLKVSRWTKQACEDSFAIALKGLAVVAASFAEESAA